MSAEVKQYILIRTSTFRGKATPLVHNMGVFDSLSAAMTCAAAWDDVASYTEVRICRDYAQYIKPGVIYQLNALDLVPPPPSVIPPDDE